MCQIYSPYCWSLHAKISNNVFWFPIVLVILPLGITQPYSRCTLIFLTAFCQISVFCLPFCLVLSSWAMCLCHFLPIRSSFFLNHAICKKKSQKENASFFMSAIFKYRNFCGAVWKGDSFWRVDDKQQRARNNLHVQLVLQNLTSQPSSRSACVRLRKA